MTIIDQRLGEQGEGALGELRTRIREPEWFEDFQNVAGLQSEVLAYADELNVCPDILREHHMTMLETNLDGLKEAMKKSDLVVATIPHRFTSHSNAYNFLLDEYKLHDAEVDGELAHVVLFPGANITAIAPLPFPGGPGPNSFQPKLNIRIQTPLDAPRTVITWGGNEQVTRTVPGDGNWYDFPLLQTKLSSFTKI